MRQEGGEEAAERGGVEDGGEGAAEEEVEEDEERLVSDRSTGSSWVWAGLVGAWAGWARPWKCGW